MKTGQYFGERALIYQKPRGATIIATKECHLAVLHSEDFKAIEERAYVKRTNEQIRFFG